MKPEFNELDFSFCLTHELFNSYQNYIIGPPTHPSLVKEKELGYDIEIPFKGVSLFLQYKVAEFMKRRHPKNKWHFYNSKFYRFKIYPDTTSPQHNLLIELAEKEPLVYYCAPRFATKREYYDHFLNQNITNQSVFIPCNQFTRISGSVEHRITYNQAGTKGFFHSEAMPLKYLIPGNELKEMIQYSNHIRKINDYYLEGLYTIIINILYENNIKIDSKKYEYRAEHNKIEEINNLLRVFFGISWLIIPESDDLI